MKVESEGGVELDFVAIVNQYEAPLLRYVAGLLPADAGEEAEDIVQNAFLRLHGQVGKNGEDSVRNMRTWLYCVSRNLVMDARRKAVSARKARERLEKEADLSPAGEDMLDELTRREACEQAMAALGDLPDKQREAVFLKVTQDLKLREIAAIMDTSVSGVAYHLNNGMRALATQLKRQGAI